MGLVKFAKKVALAFSAGFGLVAILALPSSAVAIVPVHNLSPKAKLSFTFDDGLANAFVQAAPVLAAHGLSGTSYVATDCIGMTTVPNDCSADPDMPYMSWQQLAELRDVYGWEIGGHSASHPLLDSGNLTDEELTAEIAGGRQVLIDNGFAPENFATPYGDYSNRVLAEIAKWYDSHRGFWDQHDNIWPYNNYLINNMQVQAGVPVSEVLSRIDQAIANQQWLVLTFHGIEPSPSPNPQDYQYGTAELDAIAAYAKAKQDAGQINVVNVGDGLIKGEINLLPNGSLQNGLSEGWFTDEPAFVAADSGGNGNHPEPQNSVLIKSAPSGNTHLFSPKVEVSHTKSYMLQSFLNIFAYSSGELGYYIDEYDVNDDWISGQWVYDRTSPVVAQENFTYTPSSPQVVSARLQVYVTPGSGLEAYVDNFRWFPLEEKLPPPPPPVQNLLPNSSFDSGLTEGWHTNSETSFVADSSGNGSPANPENSIRLLAGDINTSMFAPNVEIDPTETYEISAYLDIRTRTTEEVAFYVDEYDAAGNWISGQYKLAKRDTGVETINFSYQATSDQVKFAGLQIILVGGSGITGYLDDVKFLSPGAPGSLLAPASEVGALPDSASLLRGLPDF